MAVLAECPFCHRKQSARNKLCGCGEDLVKLKRSRKVRYWISYRLPGGKQRREPVGYSIEQARDADGKRRGQKRENRIFDMLPEAKMTFRDLTDWYLGLNTVRKLSSYDRIELALRNFNSVFGNRMVGTIKPMDLEEYQGKREEDGLAPATIDMEISIAKTMVTKAFDNDLIGGHTVKAFRKIKRKLKSGSNARKRTLSVDEYCRLTAEAPSHLKAILTVAYNTGMRTGEMRKLKWSHIDSEKGFIRLPAEITKEKKPKMIPINHHVKKVLLTLPRALKNDFVFTYKGEPIKDRAGLKRSFRTACETAGIPCGRKVPNGITPHDIRRTVKTNMLNAGVDKAHRDVILGHSLQGMDVHYLAPNEESLRMAMDRYTEWLDGQLAGVVESVDQSVD